MIKWQTISVPSVTCKNVAGVHTPIRTMKTIRIIATQSGSEAAKVRGLYEQMASNFESNCRAQNTDLGTLLQGVDLAVLNTINNKLGPQIPNGGIGGFLQRFSKRMRIPQILNALSTILLLHNAAMLSRNVVETVGDLMSEGLFIIGIKDEDDNEIDINEAIGQSINDFIVRVVGQDVVDGTKESWNKAVRVYQATANILFTINGMVDSIRELGEWIAENTGKIGNALKRWGVVGEDAYNWMPERHNAGSRWANKFSKLSEGLESIEDTSDSLAEVTGEIRNIQEEAGEIGQQREEFTTALKDLSPKDRPDNNPVVNEETNRKSDAQAPDTNPEDLAPDE